MKVDTSVYQRVKLTQEWRGYKKGATIEVSGAVAKQLIDDEFAVPVTVKNKRGKSPENKALA